MLEPLMAKRLWGFVVAFIFLFPILAHAQKPGSFYWGDSDMDGIISGNDYATVVSVYMDNTQNDADLYFGYPQSRYRQDLDGDGLISGADISFLESWFVGDWNTYGAPTTLEWAGTILGLTVGNGQGNSVEVSAVSYSSAGAGHWPRTGFGIIFGIDPTSQCASTVQIYGFDPVGGATVWAWRNPAAYDYQPSLLNPELGIAAVKVRAVGCALGSIIRLTAYIPGDMEYLIPGQRFPARLTISSPTILEITVEQPGCLEITSVNLSPYNPTIQENDTISFIATCTLEDESQVDCTESYCGRDTAWSAVGVLTQLTPPNLFFADIGAGLATVYAYAYNSSYASYTYVWGSAYVTVEDVTAPETTITSMPPDPSNSPDASFEFTCNEPSCTFECQLDSGGFSLCTSPQSYFGLAEGSHTFEVRAIDGSNNVDPTPASYTWVVDTPPDTIITSNPPDPTNQATATFSFICTQPPCTFECNLNSAAWAACVSPKTYTAWTPTSITSAPTVRELHTAVWTGSEMIVWGGLGVSGNLNSGGRYNPATDSWTATQTTNAPAGRYNHTAVWTGTQMVVWGGYGNSGYLNSGGKYDPVSNSWTATTTVNAPSTRYLHTAVWTGTQMIVWGGYSSLNTGGRYDPVADVWSPTTTTGAPTGRYYHTAVWAGSKMIVWGGWGGSYLYTGGEYDPVADNWIATGTSGSLPTGRREHSAVWTGSEMIVWGGLAGSYINTGGRYDPVSRNWVATSLVNAPQSRYRHSGVWTEKEMIVWGGYSPAMNTGGKYNPVSNTWIATTLQGAPVARYYHTAVWTGSEMIVWGGYTSISYLNTGGRLLAALQEGPNIFEVRAIDATLNTDPTPASYSWTIDTIPPETTITLKPPAYSNTTDALFEFNCNEASCTFQCRLDYGAWLPCSSPQSYTGLSEGTHYFDVAATDALGNTDPTPASFSWTIDITPPITSLTSYPPAYTNIGDATFDFSCNEPSCTIECNIDYGGWFMCWPPYNSWFSEGEHNFQVRCVDQAGNADPAPPSYTWTVDWTPPISSFVVTPPDPSDHNFAYFEFGCNEAAPCTYECNLNYGGWQPCSNPHTFTALPNGWNEIEIRATDAAGNLEMSSQYFSWNVFADAPDTYIFMGPPSPTRDTYAQFLFDCSAYYWPCTFECSLDSAEWSSCASPQEYFDLPDATHSFRVRAIDTENNIDPTPAEHIWEINANPPDTFITLHPDNPNQDPFALFEFNCSEDECTYECRFGDSVMGMEPWMGCTSPEEYPTQWRWMNPAGPTARYRHTAVWTGTEMIIWGGYDNSSLLNTGGRYNPVTDMWMPTSTMGDVPSPRWMHSAVWTGSEMIVWGGDAWPETNTGAKYNPATDSWTATTLTNAPVARIDHTAVWTGSEMIVWGGMGGAMYLGDGARYNPVSDSWTPVSMTESPPPRAGHTAVWTGNEMIIWGRGPDNTGYRYTPVADSWKKTSWMNAPSARTGHTAIWTGAEMIVWGGWDFNYTNTGARYDPAADTWTATPDFMDPNCPAPREWHTAVWTGKEMIIWGGQSSTGITGSGARYNPDENSWKPTPPTFLAAYNHTAVWGNSQMIVWGGYSWSGPTNQGGRLGLGRGNYIFEVRAWDSMMNVDPTPASFSWSISDMWIRMSDAAPQARQSHTAVWTGSEMIIWGGSFDLPPPPMEPGTGARYNPVTDSWRSVTRTGAPAGRSNHTAVWTGTEMIIWGGGQWSMYYPGGRYDPALDSWSQISTVNEPAYRSRHTAVWTGTEMIVWGGGEDGGEFSTGGRYNPLTDSWTDVSNVGRPESRNRHTAVWTDTEMIIFGGSRNSDALETGGRYNPVSDSWRPTSLMPPPPSKYNHSAVWTGTQMIVWGGNYGSGYDGNGMRYDPVGDTWNPMTSMNAPSPRENHTAVWTGERMIIWGGYDGMSLNSGAMYDPEFDSWNWMMPMDTPQARSNHTAVWTGKEMVVWGGFDYMSWTALNTGGRYNPGIDYMPGTDNWRPTNSYKVPEKRSEHTAVWTGMEMAIWGGQTCDQWGSGCDALYSGSRYNPATGKWNPISEMMAPQARSQHTAVWTGSKMIVWGGINPNGGYVYDSGGLYEPAMDPGGTTPPPFPPWTQVNFMNNPGARYLHTAVWTGIEMIVWGGDGGGYNPLGTGGKYDPVADSWTPTAIIDAPSPRFDHSAVWTGTEMIVWGGDSSGAVNSGARYDPAADTWVPTSTDGDWPEPKMRHTSVWTGKEMIVWGGEWFSPWGGGRYDPVADWWTRISELNAPEPRTGHNAVWTGSEMIVWGGRSMMMATVDTGGRYNPATDTWATMTTINAPTGRMGHAGVWTGTQMLIWGGDSIDEYGYHTYLNTGAKYLP